MPKVIIVVSGGNVQAAFADDQSINVEVVDHDNLEAEGLSTRARTDVENDAIAGLHQVY